MWNWISKANSMPGSIYEKNQCWAKVCNKNFLCLVDVSKRVKFYRCLADKNVKHLFWPAVRHLILHSKYCVEHYYQHQNAGTNLLTAKGMDNWVTLITCVGSLLAIVIIWLYPKVQPGIEFRSMVQRLYSIEPTAPYIKARKTKFPIIYGRLRAWMQEPLHQRPVAQPLDHLVI